MCYSSPVDVESNICICICIFIIVLSTVITLLSLKVTPLAEMKCT